MQTFDRRISPINMHSITQPTTSNDANKTNPEETPTYAQKAKNKIAPITEIPQITEEQGIVFNCISDYKIRDYLVALTNTKVIEDPKNIVACSKVSKNRIILHLKSKELVEEFFHNHGAFKIESNTIKCRRLTNPMKKIVLSHVNPIIPNSVLEEYVKNELKLELTTTISYLRLNPHDQAYGHIVSWRRQFYTNTDFDKDKIPGSFLIKYNEQNHRIFVTCDEFSCFKCHSRGHRAEDCPIDETESMTPEDYETPTMEFEKSDTDTTVTTSINLNQTQNINLDLNSFPRLPSSEAVKRPLSETSSSTHTNAINESTKAIKTARKKRKPSKTNPNISETDTQTEDENEEDKRTPTLKEIFAPLEELVTKNQHRYPITFQNLKVFVDMCQAPNAHNVAQVMDDLRITNSTALAEMLKETRELITDRKTKIKFTKIIKKIEESQKTD